MPSQTSSSLLYERWSHSQTENGSGNEAIMVTLRFNMMKCFLIQIQREARAERERVGEDWTPNFFR